MSTNNHTAIGAGAAANAATINTPLSALDAAIGDLTGMPTTPKTSVAGAIGTTALGTTATTISGAIAEHETQIGASLDPDGTLKAGAVDVAAVLASNVVTTTKILDANVTTAKLADNAVTAAKIEDNVIGATYAAGTDLTLEAAGDLLVAAKGSAADLDARLDVALNENGSLKVPHLNIVGGFDPLFRTFADPNTGGTTTKEDDLARYTGEDDLSLVIDSANPFGVRTLRFATSGGSTGGIKVHLSEAGLVVGDVIAIGMLLKIPSTVTARLTVAYRDISGNSEGTSSSTYAAGTDAMEFLSRTSQTIPADTSYLEIYAQNNAGTDPIDIYGVWVVFGTGIIQDNCEAWGYRAKYDIAEMARRGNGEPAIVNPGRLTSWMAALANIYEATSGAKARLAIIGDSVTNDPKRGIRQLAARLWAGGLANGGLGFYSAYAAQYMADSQWNWQAKQGSRTRTGTWTERVPGSTPAARGLDCTEAESTANGDKYADAMTATRAVCHYLARNGGGQFRWRVDGGAWTTVDTDNAGVDTWAKVEISGLSSASHTFDWEALEAGVIFLGWEYYDEVASSVVVHKIGHGGAKTTEWRQLAATQVWRDALANLAPDAVLINLGTNENQSAVASTIYRGYMNEIIDAVQTTLPNADVGLVVPYYTAPSISANRFSTTRRWIRQIAIERGLLCIDLSEYMHDVTHMTALSLMDDTIHINGVGGAIVGKAYYDALKF